jgi:hypothetical protein
MTKKLWPGVVQPGKGEARDYLCKSDYRRQSKVETGWARSTE